MGFPTRGRVLVGLLLVVVVVKADVLVYDKAETLVDEYNDLPARFGPSFPLDGLRVYPVMASDVYGCGPLEPPPKAIDPGAKFVVLMARSNCSFFDKVTNAELAGYKAAIVYNIDSDDLVEMSGDSSQEDVRIPAMFVGNSTAKEIEEHYYYDPTMRDFVLVLNRNLPFNINTRLLWPFVGIVLIVFIGMITMTVVRCLRHRHRTQRQRLPNSELNRLPVVRFNPNNCKYVTCSICLDDYEEGERLRVLPCQHTYHTKCIDPWLTRGKRNCPLCKRKVRRQNRRRRRRDPDSDASSTSSSSSSGHENSTPAGDAGANDTTPLLDGARGNNNNNTNGTFPATRDDLQGRNFVRRWLNILFRSSSENVVNERENPNPATVSAVVDIEQRENATPVFQAPPPLIRHSSSAGAHLDGVLVTTPISSPLRGPLTHVRSASSDAGARSSDGTPRIGVAALPNVGFQGIGVVGGRGSFQWPGGVDSTAPGSSQHESRSNRSESRTRRSRRGGGGGGRDNDVV